MSAGTYYIKVNCFYNSQFTPYTLTDSLFTYNFANDAEPNKYPYQGTAIAPVSTVTGHVNFYYNLAKDSLDWWKLNYTGSGNLQFTFNLAPKKIDGSIPFVWFYVYKDTLAAPLYANYFNTTSNVINLSSLSKANYYIKVITYYQSDFVTYSIAVPFTSVVSNTMANSLQKRAIEDKLVTSNNNVVISPNPASNRFHVQVNGKNPNLVSMILRDANGKQVWSQSNTASILTGGGLDINVSNLPSGIYFLQLTDVNKISSVKKIVIVK